ncbi:MAG TPA: hypothetical protein VLT59_14145 [Steroidobacteraceae bacterium]|nr:hypothetical protein [Steroidobacteraceae bacterium]
MDATAVAFVLAGFGVLLLVLAVHRIYATRWLAATGSVLAGGLLLAAGAVLLSLALNLKSYQRLTHETPVAQLVFEARGEQRFKANLIRIPDGEMQVLLLNGDEWQLDARVLKWRGWANLLGLDAQYRLERIAGRYRDIELERSAPRTVYELAENPGLDLWAIASDYQERLPFVDAIYGSATYLPMADGARFEVSIGQSGLVARPLNEPARTATERWR